MDVEQIMTTVQKDVSSLLIASKHGVSIQELEQDYRMLTGSQLPLRALGYKSTMELLLEMPSVVQISNQMDGTVKIFGVVSEDTKGIADLVSRQKDRPKVRVRNRRHIMRSSYHADLIRRGRVTPVLPASVKSDFRDLLSLSPLLLSEFEKAFFTRFGRNFQYNRYGFYSMLEVLQSVSDIVQVKQTRAGSLLYLKDTRFSNGSCAKNDFGHQIVNNALRGKKQPFHQPQSSGTLPSKTVMALTVQPAQTQNKGNVNSSMKLTENATPSNCASATNSPLKTKCIVQNNCLVEKIQLKEMVDSKIPETFAQAEAYPASTSRLDADNSLKWLEEKLKEDLRLCLARKGAGGSINDDLRQKIKHVVNQHSDGLFVSQLPALFKSHTGKDLPFKELGFMSIMEFVGSLGDILRIESTADKKDWQIFDVENNNISKENGLELLSTESNLSNWNSSHETIDLIKPVTTTILEVHEKLMWGPLELQQCFNEQNLIPPDAVTKQKLHCLPRMKRNHMVGVFIEAITSPSQFYIRCCGKDTSEKLEDMMLEMRQCYSNECVSERYVVPENCVSVGQIYAVRDPEDVWWYRVIVHNIGNSESLSVFYPDFGTVRTVKKCCLRFLKHCYMKLPAQAVPSSLPYVMPVEGEWSRHSIKRFQQLRFQNPLVGLVLQYVQDVLYIFLCDTSSEEDVYLHELLINQGLAKMESEPRLHKVPQMSNPFMGYLVSSQEHQQGEFSEPSMGSERQAEIPFEKENVPKVPQMSNPFMGYLVSSQEHQQGGFSEPSMGSERQAEIPFEKGNVPKVREQSDSMPCLDAIYTDTDVWDERWTFSEDAVANHTASKHSEVYTEKQQEDRVCQKIHLPEMCVEADDDAGLSRPLEEFYISLIKSRRSEESEETVQMPSPSEEPHTPEMLEQPSAESLQDVCSSPKSCKEKPYQKNDNLSCVDLTYYQQKFSANPLIGFQKFQFPRSAATVALGPAARLATAGGLLYWGPNSGQLKFM
ncbi:hypothetical protein GDO86_007753 [Hymenochirus boettgeri]|uniref:Tudor domain-containing protein 5 n=1 Tax=Hymenochirus boettgeri TaxID=247094 RepID=A0A8T2IUZ5_9PIPI|nr:hypothetical protein GDO86_007753 [Hymenochirus boettgeri]